MLDDEGKYQAVEFEFDEDVKILDLMPKIESLIGRFIMRFNSFDRGLNSQIMDEMSERYEDGRVWVFLETFTTRQKIDALFKLFDVKFEDLQIPVDSPLRIAGKDIAKRLRELNAKRNLYVHGDWVDAAPDDDKLILHQKTKRLKSGSYGHILCKISLNELEADVEGIIPLADELFYWIENAYCEISKRIDELRNAG